MFQPILPRGEESVYHGRYRRLLNLPESTDSSPVDGQNWPKDTILILSYFNKYYIRYSNIRIKASN